VIVGWKSLKIKENEVKWSEMGEVGEVREVE
jgi:hypothetical protein